MPWLECICNGGTNSGTNSNSGYACVWYVLMRLNKGTSFVI
jgi:hypothetical protein